VFCTQTPRSRPLLTLTRVNAAVGGQALLIHFRQKCVGRPLYWRPRPLIFSHWERFPIPDVSCGDLEICYFLLMVFDTNQRSDGPRRKSGLGGLERICPFPVFRISRLWASRSSIFRPIFFTLEALHEARPLLAGQWRPRRSCRFPLDLGPVSKDCPNRGSRPKSFGRFLPASRHHVWPFRHKPSPTFSPLLPNPRVRE